jgi:hypothetical protein
LAALHIRQPLSASRIPSNQLLVTHGQRRRQQQHQPSTGRTACATTIAACAVTIFLLSYRRLFALSY